MPARLMRRATASRIAGVALVVLSASACIAPVRTPVPALAAGRSVDLDVGGVVRLPSGTQVRYVGLQADSRCPRGVQCIHAGEATIVLQITSGVGEPRVVQASSAVLPATWSVDGVRLSLATLADAPGSRIQLALDTPR